VPIGSYGARYEAAVTSARAVLEREAQFRAGQVSPAGLFVYQFEVLSRNRLGYDDGLARSSLADSQRDHRAHARGP
jgi:hypothetical protein